jgi:hypothetical protein
VYGSRLSDVGDAKADILARHLRDIAPSTAVVPLVSSINVESVARSVGDADVAFGCTDDNAGRLVLSRIATYMLVPVIDCGVILSDRGGRIEGIFGRITVLSPGSACMVCHDRIDLARARTESLSPSEQMLRIREGYAPALPGVEPAVVAYTSAVASFAVAELLERMIGYGATPAPTEILLRIHDREISTNRQLPRPGHYCDPASGKIGRGSATPFLEQAWAE